MLMKTNDARYSYAVRIGRVVDYLHDRIEDELNLNSPADAAPPDLRTDIFLPTIETM